MVAQLKAGILWLLSLSASGFTLPNARLSNGAKLLTSQTSQNTVPPFGGGVVVSVAEGFPLHRISQRSKYSSSTSTIRSTQLRGISIPIEVATCLLPTCGGYVSREFGVSYAYGAATSLTAWFVLQRKILPLLSSSLSSSGATTLAFAATKCVPFWHAAALVFYGVRLCAFLFVRQQTSQRIKDLQKRIEERAESSGSRWSRTPFVLSCAYLYYGLCAPLYLTGDLVNKSVLYAVGGKPLEWLFQGLVATTWIGFLTAALGDLTKSFVKGRKGENHLVTTGIFGILRHPNYTGEMLGWTSSGLAGLVAFLCAGQFSQIKSWFYLASSVVGVMGINFVLLLATRNLEKKQAEAYGSTDEYKKWVSNSWGGFALPDKPTASETHELEVSDEKEEDGSGI